MEGFDDLISTSGTCYYISDDLMTWDDATQACIDMTNYDYDVDYNSQNTKLISIDSDDENDQINEKLGSLGIESAWIGLNWDGKK